VPVPPMVGPVYDVEVVDDVPVLPRRQTEPAPALLAKRQPWPARDVLLPDEWVLRELPRLDLDDPATYVSLWETYGPLVSASLLPTRPYERRDSLPASLVAIWDAEARVGIWAVERGRPDEEAVSVAFVRHHFELLLALIAHVLAYQEKRPLARAWASAPLPLPVENAVDAWSIFQEVLNAALKPFPVRVGERVRELDSPPFYAAAALQVFNVYVEGLPVLTCANENCQRWFQRQLGRSAKSQHRTSGVLFCSHQCADAQRQRDRRRHQRKGRQ
jgi:hypothetical protein